jgi:hypothetical protein
VPQKIAGRVLTKLNVVRFISEFHDNLLPISVGRSETRWEKRHQIFPFLMQHLEVC